MSLKKELSKEEADMMVDAGAYMVNLFNSLEPEPRTRYAYLNMVVMLDKLDVPREVKVRMVKMLKDDIVMKQEKGKDAGVD